MRNLIVFSTEVFLNSIKDFIFLNVSQVYESSPFGIIIHMLFNCNKVKEFWLAMKNWLRIQANVTLHLTMKNVIFSKQENNELFNYILLLGKYFIYKTKFLANSKILLST